MTCPACGGPMTRCDGEIGESNYGYAWLGGYLVRDARRPVYRVTMRPGAFDACDRCEHVMEVPDVRQ